MGVFSKAVLGMLFALLAFSAASCTVQIGSTQALLRPTVRIPARSVESGNGEQIVMEELDSPGDTVFLIMRGQW